VPALLLELQSVLGALTATVTAATERGRRPFRPDAQWNQRLGDLAYGVYLLADQSGVALEQAATDAAARVQAQARARQAQSAGEAGWPFEGA
jgi:hypothetical protein